MRTTGVEEELLLVDARTGAPLAVSAAVIAAAALRDTGADVFTRELNQEQLEFATRPLRDMAELREEIVRWRGEARSRAEPAGALVAALATSPLPVEPSVNAGPRYRWMTEQYALTSREQLTCGCHVHVSVESDAEGVGVLDRIRPWLALLNALSGNSPFWQGLDTGYSSYRSQVWNRWPSAGPYEPFGGPAQYHRRVEDMLATGVLRDPGMVYFDARLSHSYPTVEIRVADVCLEPDTTVLVATLARALVETAARDWHHGEPTPEVSTVLLRLASWRGARSGLRGPLIDPVSMRPASPEAAFAALLRHTEDALRASGDLERARQGVAAHLERGNGADRQRALHAEGRSLAEVVRACARITTAEAA
ncbi:glutamate--cysteine ligase [Streptomyces sp. NPDC101160]|uniref:glutamate--cysteine ligase n=1 Tax=Streptomyces sp. NPDC101160 TaxID=3366118 RepID=UPI0038124A8B